MKAYGLDVAVDDDRLVGRGDVGSRRLREIGQEDVVPDGGARRGTNVLNVEDVVAEVLVEDARLHLERGLRRLKRIGEREDRGGGARREIERVEESKREGNGRDDGDDTDEVESSHAGGAHRGDLAVGCQAAKAKKNADEHRHGDGVGEGVRQHVGEDPHDIGQRSRVADDQLEDLAQVAYEQDKGEEGSAEQGVGDDFAEDVAGEDAHDVVKPGLSLAKLAPQRARIADYPAK